MTSLPYAPGSPTSKAAAKQQVSSGKAETNSQTALTLLRGAGPEGLTSRELLLRFPDLAHHGNASRVFSVLHKEGKIMRLATSRNAYRIYVLPRYVNGRPTETPGKPRRRPEASVLNGSPNLRSSALVGLAYGYLAEIGRRKADDLLALSQTFAHVIATAEETLDRADLSDVLHHLLLDVIEENPLPFGQPVKDWDEWVATAARHLTRMVSTSLTIAESQTKGEASDGTPWKSLAVHLHAIPADQ